MRGAVSEQIKIKNQLLNLLQLLFNVENELKRSKFDEKIYFSNESYF